LTWDHCSPECLLCSPLASSVNTPVKTSWPYLCMSSCLLTSALVETSTSILMGSIWISHCVPVVANFYMEDFEERALVQVTHKLLYWFCYVDDTFIIWPHGPELLERYLDHLNGLHRNIHFIMETEKDGHFSCLYFDICRRPDGCLCHKVYWKCTHTNFYLNPGSHPILPASKPFLQPCCRGPGLCVTRKASVVSWSFLRPL